ncbi:DUF1801 domain-containing protein [Herbiconiux sp. A18JL235]|uniref:DUF1801 domain-containing protein n=1 Tax=Herbiconiux sp. A18JL235 TaxID=3152363 RepID=A0AB39BC46_9MICO
MPGPATTPSDADVTAFLDAVPDARRRAEAHELRTLIETVTGLSARLWGPSIVGFGEASYTNSSGTHEWFRVGFAPRKAALTLYGVHDEKAGADPRLEALGPHSTGAGCLYLKRLDAVDREVLASLIRSAAAG